MIISITTFLITKYDSTNLPLQPLLFLRSLLLVARFAKSGKKELLIDRAVCCRTGYSFKDRATARQYELTSGTFLQVAHPVPDRLCFLRYAFHVSRFK